MSKDLLTTQEAAAILGVGTTSIKRWADTGVLQCVKTPGGHRRFPRVAVDALVRAEHVPAPISADDRIDRWFGALLGDDGGRVFGLLAEERTRAEAWWTLCDEIAPVIEEIGWKWVRGEITVVQEHIASERLLRALAGHSRTIAVPRDAAVCLLATAEGDDHMLGLGMVEVCLREAGWRTAWAGRHTPVHLICDHVARGRADMVAVSASSYSQDGPSLADQAHRLGEACRDRGIPLLLGGSGHWPTPPPHGHRLRGFDELHAFTRNCPARGVTLPGEEPR